MHEQDIPCAWCLEEAHIPLGEGSHGICKKHAYRMIAARRVAKARLMSYNKEEIMCLLRSSTPSLQQEEYHID